MSNYEELLGEIHIKSLEGLGASYQMKGYFELKKGNSKSRINFKGVAFGGHYGGHNVSVSVSPRAKVKIKDLQKSLDDSKIEDLLAEVQRRILNGDMVVEFDRLKQAVNVDPFGNIST